MSGVRLVPRYCAAARGARPAPCPAMSPPRPPCQVCHRSWTCPAKTGWQSRGSPANRRGQYRLSSRRCSISTTCPPRGRAAREGAGSPRLDKLRLATRHFGRRPSITGVVLAAAAVAVAVAAVGIALDLRSVPSQSRSQLQTAARQTPVTTPPVRRPKAGPPTTLLVTTTPPVTVASYPAVLVSSSGGTATYQLSSPSASIVVRAKGRCWLEVRANSPLGQIVYEGILEAGQQSSVTGPAWLRVGDPPEVSVRVNGTRMPVPGAALAVPLNLQFSLG